MVSYLPYLSVTGDDEQPVELFNNCDVMATLQAAGGAWAEGEFCSGDANECCPPCMDNGATGDTSVDQPWWYDETNDASEEFFGWFVRSVDLEPATSLRRSGDSTIEPVEYSPRQLEVRLTGLGSTRRGVHTGIATLSKFFSEFCGEFSLGIKAFCFDDAGTVSPPTYPPSPAPEFTLGDGGCGPCTDAGGTPAPIGEGALGSQSTSDNGVRSVYKARFLGFDADEDVDAPFPACIGYDAVLVFDIYDDDEWGESLTGVCQFPEDNPDNPCRQLDWSAWCRQIPAIGACSLVEAAEESSTLETLRPETPNVTSYCRPLAYRLKACLLPTLPYAGDMAVDLRVSAGSADLANFSIEIVEAFDWWPRPDTCQGEELYDSIERNRRGYIPGMSAGSTLSVNGSKGTTTLECPGVPGTTTATMEAWDSPTLDPTKRYWVISRFDCYNTAADIDVKFGVTPRFRS